ncbi:L,D-transpeptidase family protein [Streptomyces antimicrobicus]|uniref:L,D-transpeptidase family protein n=1 Tax=Streptomyces antimicrobicus TaxID=2883108 RepID=A0ABS8B8S3_9ACTN|nr:L,D-transpeptidase family protein [Streptomyces antimicrobicus]MCB5180961.1 L,D-transpeptidase family protein [Streptomyces antimicrobicus]
MAAALAVPLTAISAAPAAAASCNLSTGPYQRQVESFLGLPVNGVQSASDCKAIRSFQAQHGITPTEGYAGPLTWRTMSTMLAQRAAGKNPNRDGACPTNVGRIACVDLTRQLSWIQDGSVLKYGPVPVRTGKDGTETRTGHNKIYYRSIKHWSTLYNVWMPYSQFFDGGIAFHATDKSMWNPPGSGGCVNMTHADAKAYWGLLRGGDDVYVYGRKPGT